MLSTRTLIGWVAERVISRDCLGGDLVELSEGRSNFWYARQVLQAVVFEGYADIRENKIVTLRAVAVGLALVMMWRIVFRSFNWWIVVAASPDRTSNLTYWGVLFLGQAMITWLVSVFHRAATLFAFQGVQLAAGVVSDLGLMPAWFPLLSSPLLVFAPVQVAALSTVLLMRFAFRRRTRKQGGNSLRLAS